MAETDVEMFASRAHSPHPSVSRVIAPRLYVARLSVANYPDLLSMICEHLCFDMNDDYSTKRTARVNLLSAALAFWNMSEPALNALWRTLPSIIPLVRLLPFVVLDGSSYKLALSPSDNTFGNWTRFDHYARRVRCLWLESPIKGKIVSSFLLSYISRAHKVPLLPALTSIYTSKSNTNDQSSFFSVISPTLRMVELDYSKGPSTDFVVTALGLLQDVCPRLEELKLTSSSSSPLYLIKQFANLRTLDLKLPGLKVNKDLIYELGRSLLYLEHFTLSVSDLSAEESSTPKGKSKKKMSSSPSKAEFSSLSQIMTFPNLHSLTMTGDLSTMVDILDHIETTSLRSLTLDDQDTNEGWLDCISKTSSFPYLLTLTVKQSASLNKEGYEPDSLTTALSALPPHLYLQQFTFDIPLSKMNDEVMHCFGTQFPVLRSLSLPTHVADNKHASLHSLLLLLQKLPYLDTLNVFLENTETPLNLTSHQFHSSLRNLSIHLPQGATMSTPTALALFCFHVLPGLRSLEPLKKGDDERELCNAVKKLLLVFRDCHPKLPGYYQKRLL